jgi:Holliday junction DNA helicase RuvB
MTVLERPKPARYDVNGHAPTSLENFVGQQQVVAAVKVALDACRNDNASFPHALFVGPPGLGKSNLVQIIANELAVDLTETLAQTLTGTSHLAALLIEVEARQILFIDEADELAPEQQTLAYRALAEGKLFLPRSSSTAARHLDLEDFTLILASNHESKLARPLVERFKLLCRFEFYTAQQIVQLLAGRAAALAWACEGQVLPLIAARSRGIPRTALRLLESTRRIARSRGTHTVTDDHFNQMCAVEGIDHRGLDRTERSYLSILASADSPVRLGVLADRLGLPTRTVSGVIEPFLVRQNLINRSDEGRSLTAGGIEHLKESLASSN